MSSPSNHGNGQPLIDLCLTAQEKTVFRDRSNKLPPPKRPQILGMMVEGVSIRATSRMTNASKNTIVKLLADAGNACLDYQDRALRNLPCKRIQADEIWSFVYAK